MKTDLLYLRHIAENVRRIREFSAPGAKSFFDDAKTQYAILRALQILTESTQRLSTDFKAAHPEIGWTAIGGLRNILVHDYLGVKLLRIWEIIENDLPEFEQVVSEEMREHSHEDGQEKK